MDQKLYETFRAFGQVVAERTRQDKQAGNYKTSRISRKKVTVHEFDEENRRPTQTDIDDVEQVVNWINVVEVMKSIEHRSEATALIDLLSTQLDMSPEKAAQFRFRIAERVSSAVLYDDEPLQEKYFELMFGRLVDEIEDRPVRHNCRMWVRGLLPQDEELTTESGIIIRRPQRADFEGVQYDDDVTRQLYFEPFTAVIVLALNFRSQSEAERELDFVVDVLRLTRVASVVVDRVSIFPESLSGMGGFIKSHHQHSPLFASEFTKDDLGYFVRLIGALRPQYQALRSVDGYLGIAFQRYKEALLERRDMASRVTYAISCLEALYLEGEGELSHRLAQRVAALLSLMQYERHPVHGYEEIKKAYGIRSNYVHGSVEKKWKNKRVELETLCRMVIDYARVSLLAFTQLQGMTTKDSLYS